VNIRVGKRAQHVADYFATHPGTPYSICIRGGEAVVAMVGSARLYVCAHNPTATLERVAQNCPRRITILRSPAMKESTFDVLINLCVRSAWSRSVAVGSSAAHCSELRKWTSSDRLFGDQSALLPPGLVSNVPTVSGLMHCGQSQGGTVGRDHDWGNNGHIPSAKL
jgi:hypothetical protein